MTTIVCQQLAPQVADLPANRRLALNAIADAVASGADGLLVEVHPNPDKAWSDGEQSLDFAGFDAMMESLEPWLEARGQLLERQAAEDPLPMEAAG